jgi:hypothetical protein
MNQRVEEMTKRHKELKINPNKRLRRKNAEIKKDFVCPYENCGNVYGHDESLQVHIKTKHNGGKKSDRLKALDEICYALKYNLKEFKTKLNLPPGFVQEALDKLKAEEEMMTLEQSNASDSDSSIDLSEGRSKTKATLLRKRAFSEQSSSNSCIKIVLTH